MMVCMKLSTKSTYGLRAMVAIALKHKKGSVSILDISRKEKISVDYLEQLLHKLRKDGLVRSIRGPKGGYVLSREPGAVTVGMIVKTLEGTISPVFCLSKGRVKSASCTLSGQCVTKYIWARLAKAIDDCLESTTLKDLCALAGRNDTAPEKKG